LGRRASATAETRKRIVDAAIALHAEKGVADTSWADIARRADVALGTVYRYFPTHEQLVPACTSENALRIKPPTAAVLTGVRRADQRLTRLVSELFAFYERAAPWTPRASVDRERIPVLDGILKHREAALRSLVEETLGPHRRRRRAPEATLALCSFGVWKSLTGSGLTTQAAADLIGDILMTWLDRRSKQ
jgi:AcrR family transcriptional regulator